MMRRADAISTDHKFPPCVLENLFKLANANCLYYIDCYPVCQGFFGGKQTVYNLFRKCFGSTKYNKLEKRIIPDGVDAYGMESLHRSEEQSVFGYCDRSVSGTDKNRSPDPCVEPGVSGGFDPGYRGCGIFGLADGAGLSEAGVERRQIIISGYRKTGSTAAVDLMH